MSRTTGIYKTHIVGGEAVRASVPAPLWPKKPGIVIDGPPTNKHVAAITAIERLGVASTTVPSLTWFLYGFVRKEAVISSQIEGTQATLEDVARFEATHDADRHDDVEEICNYVAALEYARKEIRRPKGLPICSRLLCQVHKRLMRGVRGADKLPGTIRTSQNWLGGTRPGNAFFVPPPPADVPEALAKLDQWIHASDQLPPLVRAGLAHVQFETIHPFLDGNGRIGRLLITLLVEHRKLLESLLLYLSLAFKRHRDEYYRRLNAVRIAGDWEGWIGFFLDCVKEAADDAVESSRHIFHMLHQDRQLVAAHKTATLSAVRLFDLLPEHPVLTLARVVDLLQTTKPTASKALDSLIASGVLNERTGRKRDSEYGYQRYLTLLSAGTELEPG